MNEPPPSLAVTTKSALTCFLTASSVEPRRPAPSVATTVTSARPIISAAAVEAVRPGLRSALSRASRPGEPPRRAAGKPTSVTSGFIMRGASMAMPTNSASTPTENVSAIITPPNRPAAIKASETPTTAIPA